MGPKVTEVLGQALQELENNVFNYLAFQIELADTDEVGRQLLLNEAPEIPEAYGLVRRLRLYAGREGQLPFLREGGYLDQPYLLSLCIEACLTAEERFRALLETRKAPGVLLPDTSGPQPAPPPSFPAE